MIPQSTLLKRKIIIKNTITSDELNELPLDHYRGEIVVVEDSNDIAAIIKEMNGEKILGFDTETRPQTPRRAKCQICETRGIARFHRREQPTHCDTQFN